MDAWTTDDVSLALSYLEAIASTVKAIEYIGLLGLGFALFAFGWVVVKEMLAGWGRTLFGPMLRSGS